MQLEKTPGVWYDPGRSQTVTSLCKCRVKRPQGTVYPAEGLINQGEIKEHRGKGSAIESSKGWTAATVRCLDETSPNITQIGFGLSLMGMIPIKLPTSCGPLYTSGNQKASKTCMWPYVVEASVGEAAMEKSTGRPGYIHEVTGQ